MTYPGPVVRVGSASGSDVELPAAGVAAHHASIEYDEPSCCFRLRRQDGQVFVNRQEVEEVVLDMDDLIEWGLNGPQARFRIYAEPGSVCKPLRRMIADARDVGASSGATAATRTLARDLFTQATLALKIGFPLLVLAIAVPLAFVGGWLGAQPSSEHVRQADRVTAGELARLRAQQRQQADELARLAQGAGLVREIQERWSQGVCLVHGIFGIKKADGSLVTDADGVPFEIEYTGSGFLADADGSVVTNGHVVAPWEEMDETTAILLGGGKPTFTHLTATFPGLAPIDIDPSTIRRRADRRDVAVFRVSPELLKGVPVLPRHRDDLQDLADHRAIVVGYPTGLAALLAQADSDLVAALQSEGATITIAIQRLAAKGSIHPTLTQGVFALNKPDLLTYDAMTTHGGSGGPVFGADGKVIGVNFAIQPGFSGANYGVPIAFANELLK